MNEHEFRVDEYTTDQVEKEDAGFFYYMPDGVGSRGPFKSRQEAILAAIKECDDDIQSLQQLRNHIASKK